MKDAISAEALELCRTAPVMDCHVDSLTWACYLPYHLERRHRAWPVSPFVRMNHVDLPRLREGQVKIVWWGIVPHPFSQKASKGAFKRLARMRQIIESMPQDLQLILESADIDSALQKGKVGCLLALEGGHALDGDLSLLERYHAGGVRAMNLVHLIDNPLGPCSRKGREGRLTALGKDAVKEMERLGIAVDLAHLQESAIQDVLSICTKPVVSSHGACAAVYPHWRNLSDESIQGIAGTGGILGVFFIRQWIGGWGGALADVVRHIEHIVEVAGPQAAAIGSDFDGTFMMPRGLEDATKIPRIAEALLKKGMPEAQVRGIMGENGVKMLKRLLSR